MDGHLSDVHACREPRTEHTQGGEGRCRSCSSQTGRAPDGAGLQTQPSRRFGPCQICSPQTRRAPDGAGLQTQHGRWLGWKVRAWIGCEQDGRPVCGQSFAGQLRTERWPDGAV